MGLPRVKGCFDGHSMMGRTGVSEESLSRTEGVGWGRGRFRGEGQPAGERSGTAPPSETRPPFGESRRSS
jgi:hypothetical protein